MKHLFIAAPAVALLLAGCQTFGGKPPVVAAAPDPQIVRAVAQQQALWQEGVINTRLPLPADVIRADGDLLSVSWSGDAVELLSHLAAQRGQKFYWTGVRLPLPVNLNAKWVSYQNVLHLIEMQTAWRATMHQLPGTLTLAFAQPQPQELSGGRK